jgi:nitroreductase
MTAYAKVMRDFVDKKSSEEIAQWMVHQVYIALGILMLGAALEGVDSCPIEGFDSARYDSILGLPDKGLKSVVLCALGFRSGQDRFTGAHKVRYPREDVVEFISSGNEV